MKAMRADKFGGPEQLKLVDIPQPDAGAGQVRILVRSAGLNPADLILLSGVFPGIGLPYIPGMDVCGEIDAVGSGVSPSRLGERVYGRVFAGGYAERTCMMANEAIPLPSQLSFAEGSGVPTPFFTAYHALHTKARLQSGETVLISGGGGGVGSAAIQLAKLVGARVIATCGSRDKCEGVMRLGADVAVNYREQNFVAEANRFTGSAGVDVILENVAADNLGRDCDAIANGGRIVVVGNGTGRSAEASFNVYSASAKDITVLGMGLANAAAHVPQYASYLNWQFADQRLRVVISKSYSLSQAPEALNDLAAGRVFGKLVLNVSN